MRKSTENTLRLKVMTDEQHGYFTAAQARLAGYASQQHVFHCDSGKWIRVKRGVFRLHGYSDSNESELAKWCLICHDTRSRPMATVSHESALLFHGLLDTPPKLPTLTVPSGFVKRIPDGCDLRRGILREDETVTKGAIKVTNPLRTLKDMKAFVEAEAFKTMTCKALEKGIVTYADLADAGLREGVAPSASYGSGHTLALLVMRSEGDFHGELRRHMTDFLQSSGIVSALVDPKKGGEPLIIQFERALRLKPSYLVIGGETLSDAQWRSYLTERQASLPPIVFLDTAERQFHVSASYIQIDYWRGAYEATRWLILQGRKRIALHAPTWVYSPESYRNSVSYDFSQGWTMALEEAGMPPGKKFFDSSDDTDNERRFLEFITSPDRPDAILAEADFRICRRIGTIRKAGLRIPDELMIVGCYNTSLSTHPDCPFPSISLREDEMARIAADIMADRKSTNLIKTVIPELIVRGVEEVC